MRREGEIELDEDPGAFAADARLAFIGRVVSPWTSREDCPKNMAAAREARRGAFIEIAAPYRPGLAGLSRFSHAIVLTWFDRAARNLIVQTPRHASEPRGVFGLRSPVRPNPIGLHVVRLVGIDETSGRVEIDAIDVLDGTPVVDLKPYFPSIDAFADAATGERQEGQ
ncbi:tRNA (N6-threonylcarbamoyladenosine(37)-N6)-methyltransferase TrmO [Mesorhizobium xinjiangense]|uniref:tRNA (N6-threonylcarbamoyladenosine(37)-N6)-methyltransferase TrmO n=1 Tax=Mesorhizobium xinjiangense TaxID=2678685 RepID=UPI0012ED91C3|nr:tRNA (N6-threonylcarbamoyladenosine(37)-N6)-methyltransferase TrmO [Mesorhizobium xinjiangense]